MAERHRIIQVLLIFCLICCRLCQITFCFCLRNLLESMLCDELIVLEVVFLLAEFVQQLIQHVNDASRLKFITISLWGADIEMRISQLFHIRLRLLQECCQGLLRSLRNPREVAEPLQDLTNLNQAGLGSLLSLLLQHCYSFCQCINRLGEVSLSGLEILFFFSTDISRRLRVFFPPAD